MAIKQRALMKLDMTKKHVLHVMRTKRKVAWGEVYRDLTEARDLYREGLPRSGYAAYGEIYDGLILAVQKVMEGGEANFQEEVLALCQELLEHLERETAKETRFKKEIFFLPYKLSMFDSLESVWRAADEDKEHCIAYVMPIPYADRNPDQTVAAWHCERDQFPKDVPTLDWQQVDLKAWHPDIVVYHSPYDNCNAVTSVDEQYYSRNLRYCADKLVYIPYFVLDEIEPGDEGAEESIAHFITAPGVLNADLIVVQSEKMRQVYIHVLARHTNQGEEYWKAHISGAGSPKIEKVLTSKKEDFEMPEKWRRLVEGKKIILYNTSLAAMLQNSDKVCDKLRYVFDVFRNRDDVVLWWRPHPLMKATFHSMRPQFEEEYLSLEKQYIEESWGIYDDSSDLHRAISWSDAYYGDMSSVVTLYRKTLKPVMIQEGGTHGEIFLYYGKPVTDGTSMWYIADFAPMIVEVDIINAHISSIISIPVDKPYVNGFGGYRNLEKRDDIIYVLPFGRENILEYNLKDKSFKSYEFPHDLVLQREKYYYANVPYGFYGSCLYGQYIYMYGASPVIVRYDTISHTFDRCFDYSQLGHREKPVYYVGEVGCFARHKLILPIEKKNIIVEFDMDTCKAKVYFFHGVRNGGFSNICLDQGVYWMTSVEGDRLMRWNPMYDSIESYTIPNIFSCEGKTYFSNLITMSDEIWLFPFQGKQAMVFDKEKKTFRVNDDVPTQDPQQIFNYYKANYIGKMCLTRDWCLIVHSETETLLKINRNNGKVVRKSLKFDASYVNDISDFMENSFRVSCEMMNISGVFFGAVGKSYDLINYLNRMDEFIMKYCSNLKKNQTLTGRKILERLLQ